MNKVFRNVLFAAGLTLASLASAQAPLTFKSVAHVGGDLSLAVNKTWATLTARGYSGAVTRMTGTSVSYRFTQGQELAEVTLMQTDSGVLVITKDSSSVVLAGR